MTIKKILADYGKKRERYFRLSEKVKGLLEVALKKHGVNYHLVTNRAKEIASLEKKLGGSVTAKRLEDIDDLAGCRIIIYLESDIERAGAILYKELGRDHVLKDKLRYAPEGYNASHLIIALDKEQLGGAKELAGFKCEVQITTVLFHAWAEVTHDVIYKPQQELTAFSQEAFAFMKQQAEKIMKDHLKEASYGFEHIYKIQDDLQKGRQVFSEESLKKLRASQSLNEILVQLKQLKDYMGKFGNKCPEEVDVIDLLTHLIERTPRLKPEPIKTVFGTLHGNTPGQVIKACLEVLYMLRYEESRRVFRLMAQLQKAPNGEISKKAEEALNNMCKYTLVKEDRVGFHIQNEILEELSEWDLPKLKENLPVILIVGRDILNGDFQGSTMKDWETWQIRMGSLPVTDKLKQMRSAMLGILINLFHEVSDLDQQIPLLKVIEDSSDTPMHGVYGDDMKQMITDDTNHLLDFYIQAIPTTRNEIIRKMENHLDFLLKRHEKMLPLDAENVRKFETLLKEKKDYELYTVLVGDFRFGYRREHAEEKKERETKLEQYIAEVSEENFPIWQERICDIAEQSSEKRFGDYNAFRHFLYKIAKRKPKLLSQLIAEQEELLKPFLHQITQGLLESEEPQEGVRWTEKWTKEGKHLSNCTIAARYASLFKQSTFQKLLAGIKKSKNDMALRNLVTAISGNPKENKHLIHFIPKCIKELTKLSDNGWLGAFDYNREEEVIGMLLQKDLDGMLNALIRVQSIAMEAETILQKVAEKNPKKVIEFFRKRVLFEEKERRRDGFGFRYEAIPDHFYSLNETLQKHEKVVITELSKWFRKRSYLMQHAAGEFLKTIFPSPDTVIGKILKKMIHSGSERDAWIVLGMLRSYEQNAILTETAKEFSRKYGMKKKYKGELMAVLNATGVVTGNHGLSEAYKRKLKHMEKWKEGPTLKPFAKEFEKYLTERTKREQKREDDDVAMMKRGVDR